VSKQRRLGRGLEALLGRGPSPSGPQIHVPPEETASEEDTPIQVNQPARPGVAPRRVEPTRPAQIGIPPRSQPTTISQEASSASDPTTPDDTSPPPNVAPSGKPSEPSKPASEAEGSDTLLQVDIDLIETNPFQPRRDFSPDELRQLSESIKAHGLLQPLLVRRVDESYQLIAGERRLRAAQAAGRHEVPVKVVEAEDPQMTELALVENLQRKDLNAMEKAASFKQHLETTGCTQEELARRLKLDRSTIANLVRLLELPEPVQQAVRQGKITQGHARALLPLGDETHQIAFARRIQQGGLSVRATERLVQETIEQEDREPLAVIGRDGGSRRPKAQNEQIAALEQELRAGLGTKVRLSHNARGRGKLVVYFNNHEEFERLRRHILGSDVPAQERAG